MIRSRSLRGLVLSVLVLIAVSLLPVAPAAAVPMGGWALHTVPVSWNLLWKFVAQAWEKGGERSDSGVSAKGSVPIKPSVAVPQSGSSIDPHG